ncbi:uncharacterized protein LOC141613749 [Silene latifolia]|uniref:uncharacterized protein LOC141613749 n=1 Tax=Silene latifolia TaxID=37657 RepID=UPI003D787D39
MTPLQDEDYTDQNRDLVSGLVDTITERVLRNISKKFSSNENSGASTSAGITNNTHSMSFSGISEFSHAYAVSNSIHVSSWIIDTDGTTKLVHQIGIMNLTEHITLHNVFIVPGFKQNMLLGHTSIDELKHVPEIQFCNHKSFDCQVCIISKHHASPFRRSFSHATHSFELLHVDVWGPYRIPTITGAKSFLPILNDHTRTTWTYLIQSKQQVPFLIKAFLVYIDTQFHGKVKVIRTDNGTEFIQGPCSTMFRERGIQHQNSIVGVPQQNGRVERKHRHLLDTARALKIQYNLPIRFWGDCLLTATYLINKMHMALLDWKTPHEVLLGEMPKYDELSVFGSLCYATVPAKLRDKLGYRARRCLFLGYPFGKKGYKLYDLEKHIVFVSRDVIFREHIFPIVHKYMEYQEPGNVDTTEVHSTTDIQLHNSLQNIETPHNLVDIEGQLHPNPSTTPDNNPFNQLNDQLHSDPDITSDQSQLVSDNEVIRRSDRVRIPSSRFTDFHCPLNKKTSKHKDTHTSLHVSVLEELPMFDFSYLTSLHNVLSEDEPTSYTQASRDER